MGGLFQWPSESTTEVLVLGAGFAKALSDRMPTTDELGNLVLDEYLDGEVGENAPERFTDGRFETWLSRLADDQPYLPPEANLRNRARFTLYSDYLAQALEDRVQQALEAGALSVPWLSSLLGCLHTRRATVLTFNQDTLVERAVEGARLRVWDHNWWPEGKGQREVAWYDVQHGAPPPPARGAWYGNAPPPTLRLVKLHGSTNWYWYPNDRTGATMASWWLSGQAQGDEATLPDENSARQRLLPGRKPFIVPPAATKSAFYDNPVTVGLWQHAWRALVHKSLRVSLLGYSLPLTDLVTANLFRETLVERHRPSPVQVDVVNLDCETVSTHLEKLGVTRDNITPMGSLEEFAAAYERRAAEEFATHCVAWQPDSEDALRPVAVGRSKERTYAVEDVKPNMSGEHELILTPYPPGRPSSPVGQPNNAWRIYTPAPITVQELLNKLGNARRLVARCPNGKRTCIVGAWGTLHAPKLGIDGWQVLISAEEVHEPSPDSD